MILPVKNRLSRYKQRWGISGFALTARGSGYHFLGDLAVQVSEPEIASRVAEGEPLVVEAEQVQDRGAASCRRFR